MGSKAESERLTRALKDAQRRPGNRRCADCLEKAPNYCQLQFRTFICSNCAAVHRELFSPKVVKSVSMAEFTMDEVKAMRAGGNDPARAVWMARWTASDMAEPAAGSSRLDLRRYIEEKYMRKRWTGVPDEPRPAPAQPQPQPHQAHAPPEPPEQRRPSQSSPAGKPKLQITMNRAVKPTSSPARLAPPTAALGSLRIAPPPGQLRSVPKPAVEPPEQDSFDMFSSSEPDTFQAAPAPPQQQPDAFQAAPAPQPDPFQAAPQQRPDPFHAAPPRQPDQFQAAPPPPQANPFQAAPTPPPPQPDPFQAAPTPPPQQGNPFQAAPPPQQDLFAPAQHAADPFATQQAAPAADDLFGAPQVAPSTNPFAQPATVGTNPFGAPSEPPAPSQQQQQMMPPAPQQAMPQQPPMQPSMPPVGGPPAEAQFGAGEVALLDVGTKLEKVTVLASYHGRATVRGKDEATRDVDASKLLKLVLPATFAQNDEAFYDVGGRVERCKIVEVHQDAPDEPPYFTVRLANTGRDRTTDAIHLLKPLAPSGRPRVVDDDPFSELVGADVAEPAAPQQAHPPDAYAVNEQVMYTVKGSQLAEPAVVLRIHYDAGLPPYYTIRLLATNAERQTDGARLSRPPPPQPHQPPPQPHQPPPQPYYQPQYAAHPAWHQQQPYNTPQKQQVYSPQQQSFSPPAAVGQSPWQQQPPQMAPHQQMAGAYGGQPPPQQQPYQPGYPPF